MIDLVATDVLRRYMSAECGADGYPLAWRRGPDLGDGQRGVRIPDLVRADAGHRCIRCGHPYLTGVSDPEWSPCDEMCVHAGPLRVDVGGGEYLTSKLHPGKVPASIEQIEAREVVAGYNAPVEAGYRVLTVHHLTMEKADCRWWNLVALCQRCHLQIQGRVKMAQVYPFEHTDWFKPYAAGYYAATYQGRGDVTREEVMDELDSLLSLERVA